MGNKGEDAYLTLGDPSQVTNVNQGMTSQLWNSLFGAQGANAANPTAFLNQWLTMNPQIQNALFGAGSPLGSSYSELGDVLSRKAVQDVAAQFSSGGGYGAGLNSGAALSAMIRGAAEPRAQLMANVAQQMAGLSQGVLGEMGANQRASLGILGQFAAPEWWQPTYAENPDYLGRTDWMNLGRTLLGSFLGTGGQLATMGLGSALGLY